MLVGPTRSQNMTVIGRRSAETSGPLGGADLRGEAGTFDGGFAPTNAAIASSNRSRSPRAKTPISLRSSPVSRGSRSASILLSRKLARIGQDRDREAARRHPWPPHMAWQEDPSVTANCPAARPTLILGLKAVPARVVKDVCSSPAPLPEQGMPRIGPTATSAGLNSLCPLHVDSSRRECVE
jgi:hypothetical protein